MPDGFVYFHTQPLFLSLQSLGATSSSVSQLVDTSPDTLTSSFTHFSPADSGSRRVLEQPASHLDPAATQADHRTPPPRGTGSQPSRDVSGEPPTPTRSF